MNERILKNNFKLLQQNDKWQSFTITFYLLLHQGEIKRLL